MSRMLTVGFDYKDNFYYSIILVKESAAETEYKITVMNGDLQSQLTGNNTIKQKDGQLDIDSKQCENLKPLKTKIAQALGQLLQLPISNE